MSDRRDPSIWGWVEGSSAVLVFAFFLYATRDLLNPVLLFALLWAVLLPFRGREGHVALLTVSATLTLLWVLRSTGSLLAPFVLAVLLAYVLDPIVDMLERRRVSRALAMGLLSLLAVAALGVVFIVALPAAIEQLGVLVQQVPSLVQRIGGWAAAARARGAANLPALAELFDRLDRIDGAAVVAFAQERAEELTAWLWEGALGLGRGMSSVFTVVGYVALTPILTFYLLRDWDAIVAGVARLIPEDRREGVVAFGRECDRMISRYLRGQLTVALILGTITWLGLWIVRFPNAGLLGLIVAVFNVVPYLGLVLSLIPALFIALVSGSIGLSLLKVLTVYGVAQVLEGSIISPRIVGDSVGLHPVTVLLALSLGSFFFGFVGLLIGVPAAAVGRLLVARGLAWYQASLLYRGGAETNPPPA